MISRDIESAVQAGAAAYTGVSAAFTPDHEDDGDDHDDDDDDDEEEDDEDINADGNHLQLDQHGVCNCIWRWASDRV